MFKRKNKVKKLPEVNLKEKLLLQVEKLGPTITKQELISLIKNI